MYRAVRGLATKAANHAPPIKIYGVHGKYAEATYVAASKVSVKKYYQLIIYMNAL